MSAGIEINLQEISDIAAKYEPGSEIIELVSDTYNHFLAVQRYCSQYESETYKAYANSINETGNSLRAVEGQIDTLSSDLNKYYEKMTADNTVKDDVDVFVAKERDGFSLDLTSLLLSIDGLKAQCSSTYLNHVEIMSQVKLGEDNLIEDIEDFLNIDKIKILNSNFNELLNPVILNTQLQEDHEYISDEYVKIEAWYDLDFDGSDHVRASVDFVIENLEKFAVSGILVFAGVEVAPALLIGGISTAFINAVEGYQEGDSTGEAVTAFTLDSTLEVLFYAGGNLVEVKSKEFFENPAVENWLIDRGIDLYATSPGVADDMIEFGYGQTGTFRALSPNEKEQLIEVINDIYSGAKRDMTIEELYEYYNNEYDIQLSEVELKIIKGISGDLSEISV